MLLNEDTTIAMDVSLRDLAVKDFYQTHWSDTLTTSKDNIAIGLSFATFNRARSNYPGHDMAIGVKMGAVKVVFTNRIVKEVATYFGAFAKMQDVLSSATTALAETTIERAKEFSETRMKIYVDITNPVVIIPRATSDAENYFYLDLGRIVIKNQIVPASRPQGLPASQDFSESLDHMKIEVVRLNLQTFQSDFQAVLFLHTNISVDFLRPITRNADHLIPDVQVRQSSHVFFFFFKKNSENFSYFYIYLYFFFFRTKNETRQI